MIHGLNAFKHDFYMVLSLSTGDHCREYWVSPNHRDSNVESQHKLTSSARFLQHLRFSLLCSRFCAVFCIWWICDELFSWVFGAQRDVHGTDVTLTTCGPSKLMSLFSCCLLFAIETGDSSKMPLLTVSWMRKCIHKADYLSNVRA